MQALSLRGSSAKARELDAQKPQSAHLTASARLQRASALALSAVVAGPLSQFRPALDVALESHVFSNDPMEAWVDTKDILYANMPPVNDI